MPTTGIKGNAGFAENYLKKIIENAIISNHHYP